MADTSINSGDEMGEAIRRRFLAEVDGGLRSVRRTMLFIVAGLAACTVVLIPVALGLLWGFRRDADTKFMIEVLRRAREFARAARPAIAFPLMVNSQLRSPGDQPAP